MSSAVSIQLPFLLSFVNRANFRLQLDQGLITCNIVARQAEYEAGAKLGVQPLTSGDKLPLLLELVSRHSPFPAFLSDGLGEQPTHSISLGNGS